MNDTLEDALVHWGLAETEARKVVEDVAGVIIQQVVFDAVMRDLDPSYMVRSTLDPELVEKALGIVRKAIEPRLTALCGE